MSVLNIKLDENDAGARTVRGYLKALLVQLMLEEEGFSGKRPFGNSGWKHELYRPLIREMPELGTLDTDGYVDELDEEKADKLLFDAIDELFRFDAP